MAQGIFEFDNTEEKGRQTGNSIGKMIASGIGVGIDENSYMAITAIENVYVELETLSKNAAKNAQKLTAKRKQRELDNLKNALRLELITEQEYYEKLKEYRDKNLRQGSDDWYKYTEEIVFYNKKLADEVLKEQEKMFDKVQKLQSELAQKLKTEDSPWFNSTNIILKRVGKGGSDVYYTKNTLDTFQDEIRMLELYRDAILKLSELGNIPDGVFADIADMDVSEGLAAASVILNANPEDRQRFILGYNTRNSLADNISRELNGILNREELSKAGIYSFDAQNAVYLKKEDDKDSFVKTLEESFQTVPASYYNLGTSSAESFETGFMEKIPEIMDRLRSEIIDGINKLVGEISQRVSATIKGAGNVYTYNSTYTFNASKDTTTAQLSAAKNAAALERLRKGGN